MATVIQIKRSPATSAPSTLKLGELAYTYGTGTQSNLGDRIFIGEGGVDSNGDANNVSVIGGQYFTDMLDHVHGTLTGNSALTADANLAIDTINVGNSLTDGGEIRFNEGTNNGTKFIGLKSPNSITQSKTFVLPDGDGTAGQFLKTDGSGNLDFDTVNQFITLAGDTGTDTYNTSETLTFAGGPGLDTDVTDNNVEIQANSLTNANLSGTAGITNANLANPQTTIGSSVLTLGQTETDIAGLTNNIIDVSLFSGSSDNSSPSGTALPLPEAAGVSSDGSTAAVGGKISTGIYTASLVYPAASSSITTVFPIWNKGGTQYHTGSAITVKSFNASNINPNPQYVSKITNLKNSYARSEKARFRLYVREKNWNPTVYTVASSEIENTIVENAYYRLYRIVDDLEVISYGTGSATAPQQTGSAGSYTRLSYDISGNYFDLDMDILQSGYSYGLRFAYYTNGRYSEQPEVFKFRVD